MRTNATPSVILTLLRTIQVSITPKQREHLHYIDSVDFTPFVKHAEKEMREYGQSPVLSPEDAIYSLKQYYALAAVNPANNHAVSRQVDPYWHSHVLHTKDYAEFCKHGIGYFMHHDPLDRDDTEKVETVDRLYVYTRDVLKTLFGENVLRKAWPKDAAICFHFGTTSAEMERMGITSFRPYETQYAARHISEACGLPH